MADRIKGITIEFDANTAGLKKAMTELNRNAKRTNTALREVNRALKLNPRSTELLSQKQKILKQRVDEVTDKLKVMRMRLKEMQNDPSVDKTSAEFQKLKRDIISAEAYQKQFTKELKRFGTVGAQQVAAVGAKMKMLGTSMAGVGRNLSMYVTMPLTLIGGAAARTTADFDSAMSKVQAISGATGKQFDALREKARQMGANTKFSATESADALSYMAMAGWKTKDMLDGLEGIMNLAAASGEDLSTTSDIVTDALTAFGLEAKDSAHFADVLASASSNANTNVSMMGETFKYVAPIAGALGYSAEDTAQAIGLMANAGIKSSQAGTSLRSIMTKLSHDFVISGKNIGDVSIAVTNADGSMRSLNDILADSREAFAGLTESEKASTAETLVGRNAMSGFLALMNASPKDINKLQSAISNADGTAVKMAETMQNNFGGQLTILKSQLSEAGISIGDTLVPFMEKLVEIVQKAVDKFNSLSPSTKQVIVVLGLIAMALGPVVTAIGLFVAALGSIMTFAPIVAGAIGAIAAPVAAVVAIVGGLIVAGVLLYKNWDSVKKYAIKIWTAIQQFFVRVVTAIKTAVVRNFTTLKNNVTAIWTAVKTKVSSVVSGLKSIVSNGFTAIKNTASRIWNSVKTAITKPIQSAKETVRSAINKIKGFFPLKIGKIFKGMKLPHFSVTGSPPFGIGGKGTKPGISVKWYRKALENPYMFSNATLFGAGESGDEMLYGRKALMRDIAQATGGGDITINVYGSDNMSVSELAAEVERRLIQAQKRRTQAWA